MSKELGFIAQMPEEPQVPGEFQVFPFGEVEIEGAEPFLVDLAAMENVVERFRARGLDMVIDYEHQTEEGSEAPAAGWIKRLESRGEEGLWAVVEWTGRAREYLARKEYRYFSPVFLVSSIGRTLTELLRVALTNAPRLNRIRPIVAKDPAQAGSDGAMDASKADSMQFTSQNTDGREEMEFLKLMAKQVGLPESANAEEVIGEVKKLQGVEIVACKEVLDALGLPGGTGKSEAVATVHALRQSRLSAPDLTLEVAALKRKLAERECDDMVSAALREGKITPAQREWAEKYAFTDAEGFRLFIAKAPQVVPLDIPAPGGTGPTGAAMPDAYQLHINKLLGVSEETWRKHNPGQGQ
ncbi:MAG: phage protease [Syntrophobacteraceae bacterium]